MSAQAVKLCLACLLLAAALPLAAADEVPEIDAPVAEAVVPEIEWAECPHGLRGVACNACWNDTACVDVTGSDSAWCYNTTMFHPETTKKSYACTTQGTKYNTTVTNVWADCSPAVEKCDVHFALGGHALTCSGLTCEFEHNGWKCDYVKCQCDGTCPVVDGVSLGYMLEKLQSKASFACKESWGPPSLCSVEVEGLTGEGGFEAYCAATECRI